MRFLTILAFLIWAICPALWADDTIANDVWKVTCEKGEVTELQFNGTPVITEFGGFRVAGRDVRSSREVAELREKKSDILVYEGICDNNYNSYVEFGQVAKINKDFEFSLLTFWIPPSPWPLDAAMGFIRFSDRVVSAKEIPISEKEVVTPGTVDLLLDLKNKTKLKIRITGIDGSKNYLKRERGVYVFRFEGARNYMRNPWKRMNTRYWGKWLSATKEHTIKFVFSGE